jgi:Na+/H+ antiporter NhaD/arsenite permease-like protein
VTEPQIYLTVAILAGVILVIALDVIDMAVAALLGVGTLLAFGLLNSNDLIAVAGTAGGPLALLFGGMVVARVLAGTGIFDWLEARFLEATRGSGRRFLLLLITLVAAICTFLPNATTVILIAPVVIGVSRALKVNFGGPMILAAVVSNAAGMLTLVGDSATFLVGSAIGLSFGGYLVAAEAVPEVALATGFVDWPASTLPIFIAMMFGATLGGNATLIGASANVVAVGICAHAGERVSFMRFLRYGLPITLAQLTVGALYVFALGLILV